MKFNYHDTRCYSVLTISGIQYTYLESLQPVLTSFSAHLQFLPSLGMKVQAPSHQGGGDESAVVCSVHLSSCIAAHMFQVFLHDLWNDKKIIESLWNILGTTRLKEETSF